MSRPKQPRLYTTYTKVKEMVSIASEDLVFLDLGGWQNRAIRHPRSNPQHRQDQGDACKDLERLEHAEK